MNTFPLEQFLAECNQINGNPINKKTHVFKPRKSKKNAVVECIPNKGNLGHYAVKYFPPEREIHRRTELRVLNTLHEEGLRVPGVILDLNDFLVLQWVNGIAMADMLSIKEERDLLSHGVKINLGEIAKRLGTWLADLHYMLDHFMEVCSRGDANLRNFIFSPEGEIWAVDFENASARAPVTDIWNLFDSILILSPGLYEKDKEALEWKLKFCVDILESYFAKGSLAGISGTQGFKRFMGGLFDTMETNATRRNIPLPKPLLFEVYGDLREQINSIVG